jgi:thiamine biosynthesis protein ThiS
MTVTVNGKPMELPEGLNIDDLLSRLNIRREVTAVALNREVPQRARYAETKLQDGDTLEIVHPMGGG